MSLATPAATPEVSVLVPAKDEVENLPEFVRQARDALLPLPYAAEVVVIDDGSRDGTAEALRELAAKHAFVRVITHRSQRGIADALRSGADAARGRVLVFYPADLQYSPADIPGLVAPILDGEADIVTGTKQGHYDRRFVSWVYNALCRWMFGVRVTDLNSVKAYRREVVDGLPTRPDWHRFMVVIAAAQGFRLREHPVSLQPRRAGRSKFGIGRIPVGVLDLVSVWFQLRFGRKPMLFFGVTGAALICLGGAVGAYALVERYVFDHGNRAFLYLVLLLVIAGLPWSNTYRSTNAYAPTAPPRQMSAAPVTPKNSIGLRPNLSWNHTDTKSSTPTGMRPMPNFDRPARRGWSETGCSRSRKPCAAAMTTMKRCQSGRVGRPSTTSRRYAFTEFRSVTRTPNSQRHSAL